MDFFPVLVLCRQELPWLKPRFLNRAFLARKRTTRDALADVLIEFFVRTSHSFRVRLHVHVSRIVAK
jgi:hypothetical protein